MKCIPRDKEEKALDVNRINTIYSSAYFCVKIIYGCMGQAYENQFRIS